MTRSVFLFVLFIIQKIHSKDHNGHSASHTKLLHRRNKVHFLQKFPSSFLESPSISHPKLYRPSKEGTHEFIPQSMLQKLREHKEAISKVSRTGKLVSSSKHWKVYDAGVSGTIRLSNLEDSQYVGPIGVGTVKNTNGEVSPQNTINVVFDTGSTNLWIATTLCKDKTCVDRSRFDPEKSLSFMSPVIPSSSSLLQENIHSSRNHKKKRKRTILNSLSNESNDLDITFGTGELKGPLGIDRFSVGPYSVQNQSFAMIRNEIGQVFSDIQFEGILGVAFPSMSAKGIKVPFFDNVIDQNVLKGHNEFSFYFTKLPEQTSAIFFGGVDPRFFEGKIKMFPVTQEHYWSLDLVDFKIGNVSYADFHDPNVASFEEIDKTFLGDSSFGDLSGANNNNARVSKLIVDTGTTYFTAPPGLSKTILDKLPRTKCSNLKGEDASKYPPITYVLKDENGAPFNLEVPSSVYMVSAFGDDSCEPAFMEIPVPEGYGPGMLLGEVFMRHWFTVFDRGSGKNGDKAWVGFAPAKHTDENLKSLLENGE